MLSLIWQGILVLGVIWFLVRLFSRKELDDVHPRIQDIHHPLVKNSKWLWVMPLYMDDPISNHPQWVAELKASGKIIGLHGVKHTYNEFKYDLPEDYIKRGIDEFTKAFGYAPKYFKAPKLALSKANAEIIKKYGMEIKGVFNQLIHHAQHIWTDRLKDGRLPGEYYTHGEDGSHAKVKAYLGIE